MSPRRIVGVFLVVIGLVAVLMGGISWTQQKTVLDVGPLEVKSEEHKRLPLPPVFGIVALIGGVLLLVVPDRRRA